MFYLVALSRKVLSNNKKSINILLLFFDENGKNIDRFYGNTMHDFSLVSWRVTDLSNQANHRKDT